MPIYAAILIVKFITAVSARIVQHFVPITNLILAPYSLNHLMYAMAVPTSIGVLYKSLSIVPLMLTMNMYYAALNHVLALQLQKMKFSALIRLSALSFKGDNPFTIFASIIETS